MQTFKLSSKHFFPSTSLHTALGAFLLCCSAFLYAEDGSNHDVEVTEQGGVYHIKASVVIDAQAEYVRLVLSDFVHIYRLNPSIIESEVLGEKDDTYTFVRTRILGCAGYFCKELERVEKVRELPSGDLVAEIMPEKSEFRSGKTVWHIDAMGNRSRVVYDSEIEPDFYIPPVVGKFMAKKSIRTETDASLQNLEKIANVLAERDWIDDFRLSSPQSSDYTPCGLAAR
jgi:Polyketide cyclase / dehydrase and lipid transport